MLTGKHTNLTNHISWVFFPARFLFGRSREKVLRLRGWETLYFVDQPDEVKAVNAATGNVFLGGAGNEFLMALLGPQSVFCIDHQQHRLSRRIMGPVLTKKAVDHWTPAVDSIIAEELGALHDQHRIVVGKWSRRLCMRVVCRVALGLESASSIHQILRRFEDATGYLANIVSYAKPLWKANGLFSPGTVTEWFVKRIDAEIYPLISREQQLFKKHGSHDEHATNQQTGLRYQKTVLRQLVEEQAKHGYDDAFIRDNLVAVLAAGYDTSGSALSWMFYWLCRESDHFDLLLNELRLGNHKPLEAFRDEVLRYCPPIEILPRRIDKGKHHQAQSLLNGLQDVAAAGMPEPMVCPFIHRIHHNSVTYSEPQRFNPTRFSGSRKYSNHEFLPFGAGHRMCIGMNLGKSILDRTLISLLQQQLRPTTKQPAFKPIRRNVSIWPGHSFRATFDKPKGQAIC